MDEPITISFVGTNDLKTWLEQKAKADDRSVSYVLRQILERERRKQSIPAQVIQQQPAQ